MKRPKLRSISFAVAVARFSWWFMVCHWNDRRRARNEDHIKGPLWYRGDDPVWRSNEVVEDATARLRKSADQLAVEHWFNEGAEKA